MSQIIVRNWCWTSNQQGRLQLSPSRKHKINTKDSHYYTRLETGYWYNFQQKSQARTEALTAMAYGPYRVIQCQDPDLVVSKVYFLDEGHIQIYTSTQSNPMPSSISEATTGMDTRSTVLDDYTKVVIGNQPRWMNPPPSINESDK